jgi:Holliday junction DNA helicase RuvA
MYEYIKGQLTVKEPTFAVVESHGIGYKLVIPVSNFSKLPPLNSSVELFLSHIVREDSEALFAFITKNERDLFEKLITISGIGPRTAIGIIGHLEPNAFHQAIQQSDIRLLTKIPGIGKKTAERLVIEMRDSLQKKNTSSILHALSTPCLKTDALSALINLGYAPLEAQKAVEKSLEKGSEDLGTIITLALKNL